MVLSEFRGKGISKKLVQAGIEELKRNGYEEVRLNVFSTNFAQEIHEKIGFTPLQTVMVYKKIRTENKEKYPESVLFFVFSFEVLLERITWL